MTLFKQFTKRNKLARRQHSFSKLSVHRSRSSMLPWSQWEINCANRFCVKAKQALSDCSWMGTFYLSFKITDLEIRVTQIYNQSLLPKMLKLMNSKIN